MCVLLKNYCQENAYAIGFHVCVLLKTIVKEMLTVLRPRKGECADPVNEDAILEKEGGGAPQPE